MAAASAAPFSFSPTSNATSSIFFAIPSGVAMSGMRETLTPASSTAFNMSGGPAKLIAMTAVGFSDSKPSEDSHVHIRRWAFPLTPLAEIGLSSHPDDEVRAPREHR